MLILYDGECPFCTAYVRMLRLKDAIGHVELCDIRSDAARRKRAIEAGLDLDEGMAVLFGGKWSHGSNAVVLLSTMSTQYGFLNSAMARLFRSPTRAALLYPMLRIGRNLTLRILGRQKIGTDLANHTDHSQ